MVTVWLACAPEKLALRLTGLGLADRPMPEPALDIFRVTWKVNWPDGVVTVTFAVSLTPENCCGLTFTVRIPGVPELNTFTQPWPVFVMTEFIVTLLPARR